MKQFIMILISALAGFIVGVLGYKLAEDQGWVPSTPTEILDEVQGDPGCCEIIFTDKAAIYAYQAELISQRQTDSIIMDLPLEKISNIMDVILARDSFATPESVVHEYLEHRQIYDALNNPPDPNNIPSTSQNAENTSSPVVTTSPLPEEKNKDETYILADSVIDGKLQRVVKKV